MNLLDLVRGDDGKMVLTKLQASTFHLLLAITVATVTAVRVYRYVKSGEPPTGDEQLFDFTMWSLYAAVAVGHHILDKTGAQVSAFKNKQLEVDSPPSETLVTTETKTVKS